MSSNDQIVIIKKDGKFEAHYNPYVDNEFRLLENKHICIGNTVSETKHKAKKWYDNMCGMCGIYPDYGIIMNSKLCERMLDVELENKELKEKVKGK